jgi:hypothetical protein
VRGALRLQEQSDDQICRAGSVGVPCLLAAVLTGPCASAVAIISSPNVTVKSDE